MGSYVLFMVTPYIKSQYCSTGFLVSIQYEFYVQDDIDAVPHELRSFCAYGFKVVLDTKNAS